jgi:riboflavin kinase/FMN adenylyltransferase
MLQQESALSDFIHLKNLLNVPDSLTGAVIAIGNFDGVHRGHQSVLEQAKNVADHKGVEALAMTFEPHPKSFFQPQIALFRLTEPAVKANLMQSLQLNGLIEIGFDKIVSTVSPESFIENYLVKPFQPSAIVTGQDFRFGKGRQGDVELMKTYGKKKGFEVVTVPPFEDEGGEIISSTRIRQALARGDIAEANGLLGYRWFVSGEVIHGEKRGRELGYPTANMALPESCGLKHGIYAVTVKHGDAIHAGVASYGRRPTFGDLPPLLETYIFDFQGDLYGQNLTIVFHGFLRAEEKFDSAQALMKQMDQDAAEAQAMLSGINPLTPLDLTLGLSVP